MPWCVKLLQCQKITALHTATHALVIRGRLVLNPGAFPSAGGKRVHVVESQAVLGTSFPPPDKQSIANYFWHKAEDSNSTDMIKFYDARHNTSAAKRSFLFKGLRYCAHILLQPVKRNVCFSRWRPTFKSQRADSIAASVTPLTVD